MRVLVTQDHLMMKNQSKKKVPKVKIWNLMKMVKEKKIFTNADTATELFAISVTLRYVNIFVNIFLNIL